MPPSSCREEGKDCNMLPTQICDARNWPEDQILADKAVITAKMTL